MDDGVDLIADDELLYRRIPVSTDWYDLVNDVLKPEAFGPHRDRDATGLSLIREK